MRGQAVVVLEFAAERLVYPRRRLLVLKYSADRKQKRRANRSKGEQP